MKQKLIIVLALILWLVRPISGQELNQSNLRYLPMYLNPGLCGNYPGSARVGGSYRDQGDSWMLDGYHTYQFFTDMPVAFSFKDGDWAGLGIQLYGDKAGTLPVTTNGAIINLAYHLSLDKKQKNILSLGMQYGLVQRKLDNDQIILESDHIDPGVPLNDRDNFLSYTSNYNDINFGLHFKSKLANNGEFSIGVSAYHLLQTNSTFGLDANFWERRYAFHSAILFSATKQLFFKPEITVLSSKNALNIMPQLKVFFKLNKDKKKRDLLYFGTGYRINDAIQIMFGLNYKGWDIGVAYDITTSSAAGYNHGQGGFEIGVSRIFLFPTKPEIDPVLICPRL